MSVYTISPDLLRGIENDQLNYFNDILFVFTHKTNALKVASDKQKSIIRTYASIEKHKHIISTWLELMAHSHPKFEPIDIDISNIDCEETKFFKLCKETNGNNKIIFFSKQNIKKFPCQDGKVIFESKELKTLDRDEAIVELNKIGSGNTYNNSIVADNGGSVTNSKNKN